MTDPTALSLPAPGGAREAGGRAPRARAESLSGTVRRLRLLRFPLAISVLFFHSARPIQPVAGSAVPFMELEPWAALVQGFFAHGLGGIRMPAFFAISGFLFFADCAGTREWLSGKLGGRVRGVLVPLLAWNALLLLLLLLLQSFSLSNALFSGVGPWSRRVADYDAWQVFDALVGVGGNPILYPLWFLRDLFFMSLLAPVFYVWPRGAQTAVVAAFGTLWLTGAWPYQVPTVEACFFFLAGALAALRRFDPQALDRHAGAVFALLAALVAVLLLSPPGTSSVASVWLHLTQLAALAALLVLTKFVEQWPTLALPLHRLAAPSFFIFVAHEPLLTAVRRLAYWLWQPQSSTGALGLYFAGVIVTSLMLIGAFRAGQRWAPGVLTLLTGGRSRPPRDAKSAPA
ncbi:MAG: acyltransferase family protein [Rhodoferax sp.]|nr:acyltransferase family protein [Rhodoferax sp.]MDP3653808.1 acyltransferase family protein [Rhodoferax sp.]